VEALTVDDVRAHGDRALYPTEVLEGCESALVLFAAAFLGRQDACWVEEAGLVATCVDSDDRRLQEMLRLYPEDWTFVRDDAFSFVTRTARMWDVVSVDCPSGAFERCAAHVTQWCQVARRAAIIGTAPGERLAQPPGWRVTRRIRRSSIAYWTVMERA
jgi:hypothetical protein